MSYGKITISVHNIADSDVCYIIANRQKLEVEMSWWAIHEIHRIIERLIQNKYENVVRAGIKSLGTI